MKPYLQLLINSRCTTKNAKLFDLTYGGTKINICNDITFVFKLLFVILIVYVITLPVVKQFFPLKILRCLTLPLSSWLLYCKSNYILSKLQFASLTFGQNNSLH